MIKIIHLLPSHSFLKDWVSFDYLLHSKRFQNAAMEFRSFADLKESQKEMLAVADIIIEHSLFSSLKSIKIKSNCLRGFFIHRFLSENELFKVAQKKYDFFITNSAYQNYFANHRDKNFFTLSEHLSLSGIENMQTDKTEFAVLSREDDKLFVQFILQVREKINQTGKTFDFKVINISDFSANDLRSVKSVIVNPRLFNKEDSLLTLKVITEILSLGKTVIAENISNIANLIVHEETGIVLPSMNVSTLSHACHFLISFPEIFMSIRESIRKNFQINFNDKTLTGEYENIIDEVIKNEKYVP